MAIYHLTITVTCQIVNYSSIKNVKVALIELVKQALKSLPGTIDFTSCNYIDIGHFTIDVEIASNTSSNTASNIVIVVNSYLSHYIPTEYNERDVHLQRIRMSTSN